MWLTSKEFRKKYNISPQHLYALKKAGRYEEARDLLSIYDICSGLVHNRILDANEYSEDILFSEIMEEHWPKDI